MELKDRFIILKKLKFGEADLIVHALSPRGEKMSFIARGAMKSKKRFGGGILEPSHFVQFTYKESKPVSVGGLKTLTEATLLNDFKNVRSDYDRLELALHILECTARVSQEGDQNSASLFNLLGNSLAALETAENISLLKLLFNLKFLSQQGVLTIENWMEPFLGLNIGSVNDLSENRFAKRAAEVHLSQIDFVISNYIKTAEHH